LFSRYPKAAGFSPERIAPVFGVTRRQGLDHRDRCLTGERREKVEADLRRMAGAEGGRAVADGRMHRSQANG
jgi:hypothetical protein